MGDENECALSSFGLQHRDPKIFVEPQWGGRSVLYASYRVALALFFLVMTLYAIIIDLVGSNTYRDGNGYFPLVYFTIWCIIALAVDAVLQAKLTVSHILTTSGCSDDSVIYPEMPNTFKALWVIHNIVTTCAPVVTAVYWEAIQQGPFDAFGDGILCYDNIYVHVLNTVYVLLELITSGIPVRVLHFIYPLIVLVIYIFFYLIIWWTTSISIYLLPQPGLIAAFSLIASLIGVPILQLILYGLYRLRVLAYSAFKNKSEKAVLYEPFD